MPQTNTPAQNTYPLDTAQETRTSDTAAGAGTIIESSGNPALDHLEEAWVHLEEAYGRRAYAELIRLVSMFNPGHDGSDGDVIEGKVSVVAAPSSATKMRSNHE